jgi:hypothetical protein
MVGSMMNNLTIVVDAQVKGLGGFYDGKIYLCKKQLQKRLVGNL